MHPFVLYFLIFSFLLSSQLYKLPVLFVDDFADVNSALLKSAYVEALYRAEEFEFERLTQSFWYDLIGLTASTGSNARMLEKFPMTAEDPTFTRPAVVYECGKTNSCGPGTKRIPKRSC